MAETVEFRSNGHVVSGYLATPPAGSGPGRAGHPGVVGPRFRHQGDDRPPGRRGFRGARAGPLPRRPGRRTTRWTRRRSSCRACRPIARRRDMSGADRLPGRSSGGDRSRHRRRGVLHGRHVVVPDRGESSRQDQGDRAVLRISAGRDGAGLVEAEGVGARTHGRARHVLRSRGRAGPRGEAARAGQGRDDDGPPGDRARIHGAAQRAGDARRRDWRPEIWPGVVSFLSTRELGPDMQKKPTIATVAAQAGVAVSTVSRYLNGHYVSREVRARLSDIIAELGYSRSWTARNLSLGRRGSIGVVVDSSHDPWFVQLLTGIEEELSTRDTSLMLASTELRSEYDPARGLRVDQGPARRRPDCREVAAPRAVAVQGRGRCGSAHGGRRAGRKRHARAGAAEQQSRRRPARGASPGGAWAPPHRLRRRSQALD